MRSLSVCLLAVLASFSLQAAPDAGDAWGGRPLAEFLDSLEQYGLRVIFSSDLVGGDLLVDREPDLDDLRATLPAFLAPYGLTVTPGPGDTLLVVRVDNRQPAPRPSAPIAEPELAEIVVTSSLHRMQAVRTETHTYLDRELATSMPGASEEIVRLTNRMPGTASGGISTRNHVRGGEVNEVLFLLDGLRLYEPFHLKNFQSVATIVNSSIIEGIDFYTGAYPARYGDRMSGVMNLTVREPVRELETELALSFFNASALSLGRLGAADQGDWLLAARRGNLDLVFDVVDPDFGAPNYNDTMLHLGWEFGPRGVFTANYLTSTDKIFIDDRDRGETARADYLNEVFWGKWLADWSDRLSSATILSYSSIRNDRSGELDLPGIVRGELRELSRFRISALKQDWTFVASRAWMLSAGLDAKHLDGYFDFDSTRTIEPPFDELFGNAPLTQRSASVESDGDQFAVYVEAKWQPRPDLVVEGGARWDQQSYTLASGDTQSSPRLSVLYRLNEHTELRIGWGQFSQAQEANELQVSDGVYEFFAAQRAEHVVANLKHRFDNGVDLDLSLYRKSFRKLRPRFENAFNPLTIVPEIQFDRLRIDARQGISQGAEILLSRGAAEDGLFWWLGYVWSSVEDRLDGGDVRRSWDQTHAAKTGLSWRWRSWNFSAAGEAHTGWPRTEMTGQTVIGTDGSAEIVLDRTAFNGRRHSVYHTLDARVSREFGLRRGTLTAFLEVTNLYNRKNSCCLEYSVRTVDGRPALGEREANWLPLLPSLGIIWNF